MKVPLVILVVTVTASLKFNHDKVKGFSIYSNNPIKRPSWGLFDVNQCDNNRHVLFSTSSPSFSSEATQEEDVEEKDLDSSIQKCLDILYLAAETKQVDSDEVYNGLVDLEKLTRQKARVDPSFAQSTLIGLDGSWRLIFTTGTADTQKRIGGGRINYFPLKAVQSFRTKDVGSDEMHIENGIYVGDFPAIKFSGTMEFDLRKRRLEFDFDNVLLLNMFDVKLKKGEAASLGSKTGLGSDSNVKNSVKDKKAFFNWISADERIATARGGGGGLALWKRLK